jgi:hypothetical protein
VPRASSATKQILSSSFVIASAARVSVPTYLVNMCAWDDCGVYTCMSTTSTWEPRATSYFRDNCYSVERFYGRSQERHSSRTWEQYLRRRSFRSRSCVAIVVFCSGSMSSALRNQRRPRQAIAEGRANLQRTRPRYLHAGQDGRIL